MNDKQESDEERFDDGYRDGIYKISTACHKPEELVNVLNYPETKEVMINPFNVCREKPHCGHLWDSKVIDFSPLSKLDLLEKLTLHMVLTQVDLSPLSSCNSLTEFRMYSSEVRYIDLSPLSNCPVTKISLIRGELRGIRLLSSPTLQVLDLEINRIESQSGRARDEPESAFVPKSEDVNPETQPFYANQHLYKVKEDYLLQNGLVFSQLLDLSQLLGCTNLESINLYRNSINHIDLTVFSEFERKPFINLRDNPLKYVNIRPLVSKDKEWYNRIEVDEDVKVDWVDYSWNYER